jgi:amino acid transporter
MPPSRSIGVWALIGLMLNNMIGSGIFGVPGELARLLGRASPAACVIAGLAIAVIVACFVEVGSQFSESGGPYLYVRTAFGRLFGIQVAWFTALAPLAAASAQATLFATYLAGFVPAAGAGAGRAATIIGVVALPVIANLIGVRTGKGLSSLLVVAKLLPLAALIVAGIAFFASRTAPPVPMPTTLAPIDSSVWLTAVLIAVFSYGGFENALAATGEVRDPRRFVPLALVASLVLCMLINALIQWVTSRALEGATGALDRPLAAAGSVVMGSAGATLISAAALVSTAGAISATVLAVPRLLAALGERGDLPQMLARGREGGAPVLATLTVAAIVVVLGVSGTFKWALAVTAGSMTIFAGAVCAALPRLRVLQPHAAAVRVPGGSALAVVGIIVSALLLLQLQPGEAAPIGITIAIALLNWWLVRRRDSTAKKTEIGDLTSGTRPRPRGR